MQKLPELQDVASDQQIAAPHIAIEIDRDMASRLGISPSLIDETLYDAFGQRQVATMYTSTSQYKVVLEVKPEFRDDPTALSKIYVNGPGGAQLPLSAFAHFTSNVESLSVNHQGQFPAVTLSFNLAPGIALGQAVDKIHQTMAQLRVPATLEGAFQGTAQAFQASLSSTPLLVAAAILVVYIVLGMLYESYIHPITILSALPSAGVGALLALMLLHYDLSVIAMIGVILLIGIVKKNAIMMIDFALQAERIEGKSPREAIHQACLLRFRPIMMTTFAALFGAIADRLWPRRRLRAAAAARHRDRWWIACLSVVNAVHHTGDLPISRAVEPLVWAGLPPIADGRSPRRSAAASPRGEPSWRRMTSHSRPRPRPGNR